MIGLLGWCFLGKPLFAFRYIGKRFLARALIGISLEQIGKALQGRFIVPVPEIEMTHIKLMLSEVDAAPLDVILGLQGILIIREGPDQPLKLMEGLDGIGLVSVNGPYPEEITHTLLVDDVGNRCIFWVEALKFSVRLNGLLEFLFFKK